MKLTHLYTSAVALSIFAAFPANGASLFFSPAGSQLDTDAIADLAVNVGDFVDLSFFLDTAGLSSNLQAIDIRVDQDLAESSLSALRTDADINAFPDFSFGGSPQSDGLFSAIFQRSGNPGLAANTTVELVTGTLEILPGLNNDGITDFSISVVSAFDAEGNDVTSLFGSSSQSLELQQAIPEPTSLITLLGLGCLGFSSLMKKGNK